MRETSSADLAWWKAWDQVYGLPGRRADMRAALISRFAGAPHSVKIKDLMAHRWLPVLSEKKAEPVQQSPKAMQRVLERALFAHTGKGPEEVKT